MSNIFAAHPESLFQCDSASAAWRAPVRREQQRRLELRPLRPSVILVVSRCRDRHQRSWTLCPEQEEKHNRSNTRKYSRWITFNPSEIIVHLISWYGQYGFNLDWFHSHIANDCWKWIWWTINFGRNNQGNNHSRCWTYSWNEGFHSRNHMIYMTIWHGS